MEMLDLAHRSMEQDVKETPIFIEHESKIITRTLFNFNAFGNVFVFACSQNAGNGVYKIFSSTAAGYLSVTCKDDRPDGVASRWLPCGFMKEEWHYKLGHLNGRYTEYNNCTDNVSRTGQFVDDVQDGKWVGFRNDNSLDWEQFWAEGKLLRYVYHPHKK